MSADRHAPTASTTPATPTTPTPRDQAAEVVAFLRDRSVPCPRCTYDLRDAKAAKCPECAEPLELRIGSPKVRFGWLVFAMAPGCFSGIAAMFLLVPIAMTIGRRFPPGQGLPGPVIGVELFGIASAASVMVMYRHRHRIMSWTTRRQGAFAGSVWGLHLLALLLFLLATWLWS